MITGLACSLSGEGDPTATVAGVATPTLAPSATPDFAATVNAAATPKITPEATVTVAGDAIGTATGNGTGDSAGTPGSDGTGNDSGDGSGGGNGGGGAGGNGGSTAACPAGGQNLLQNPSFEGDYKPFGAFTELNHAALWFPWWRDGENNLRPEFKPAEQAIAANRVHSGTRAQQYFKSFGMFKAGVSQSVLNVPIGARLQLSAYGQAWSCEEFNMCPDGRSVNPANMFMRVGIDPYGDTNPFAPTIVWSEYFNPLDAWQIACVETVAEAEIITVYLWASPDGPRQNQDVYWDDASLVILR